MSSTVFRPFRFLHRMAHEQPVYLWSFGIGLAGPVMVLVVPEIRKSFFNWKPADRLPTSYPLPNRERRLVAGFEDSQDNQ
ncbi:NADH-ubiquinone oxidoreductase 9.5 kDa subunit [Wallemia ichthyophaga EXF-994]|uniref:NADH-ubiquinone oxidoreductase 9.5 kDa subunit n=1 Tax=Wallemia ichthyophaga (strain EXF-994 / CBS 113033) TaxID=1299270 RepID=R9APF1_WALI9|nr:NADH-ubiquinone oxidoreductase 9.5 kDa subunit [Wallemia ichthyophaga EXF-994]EOR04107.1 NADH-ubiquinone oxidoreductase 9.5 kDa subunit [Wallemia ichthyophaga EXF-994]